MEFKRFDVIVNAAEMRALGRDWSDMSPDMRFAFRRQDLGWLTEEFESVVDNAGLTLESLKKYRHLSRNTEQVFAVQSNRVVAGNALADIAAFKEKLKKRQHKNLVQRHRGLFLEPPIEYDDAPDPAS